jgi:hypothetical protein
MKQHDIIKNALKREPTRWFTAKDFQSLGSIDFVGYEASARMSELVEQYPDRIERKMVGKFRAIKYIPIDQRQQPKPIEPSAEQPKAISWLHDED